MLQAVEIHACRREVVHLGQVFSVPVSAGFPSPAEDYLDAPLDLNELVIQHPSATYFVRVQGESMQDLGILDGSIVVVDAALEPRDGDVVIAAVDGEFTVKQFVRRQGRCYLHAANPDYAPIELMGERELTIMGVVTHSLTFHR
ncbi:MAG: translesion error-prone DNA polymerase V autoproteolytic subunit [Bacteroidota bacterium]